MALKDDIHLMASVPAFVELGEEQLRLLAFGAEHRRLEDGQILFREASPADCAFVVVSGQLALSTTGRNGENVEAGIAGPGAMVSELAMIAATERKATAAASGNTEVLRITRALFHRMMEEYPDVGRQTETRLRAQFSAMAKDLAALQGKFRD